MKQWVLMQNSQQSLLVFIRNSGYWIRNYWYMLLSIVFMQGK